MLINLLQEISASEGQDLTNPVEKNLLISRLNRVGREIHNKFDIEECIQEKVYDFNVESQQVALPFYVDQVRAMKMDNSEHKVIQDAAGNLYNEGCGNNPWALQWRKKERSAVKRNIENESVLKVVLPEAEEEDVIVYILGATENSSLSRDTITVHAGEVEALGEVPFKEPIQSITKNSRTRYNVQIQDSEDNLLAEIPNWSDFVNYKIYQISNTEMTNIILQNDAVSVRFKHRYIPVESDFDLFWGTDTYDDVVLYKYFMNNTESSKVMLAREAQALAIMNSLVQDQHLGTTTKMSLKRPAYFQLPYASGYRNRG